MPVPSMPVSMLVSMLVPPVVHQSGYGLSALILSAKKPDR